jgi:hypothetical protein
MPPLRLPIDSARLTVGPRGLLVDRSRRTLRPEVTARRAEFSVAPSSAIAADFPSIGDRFETIADQRVAPDARASTACLRPHISA